TRRHAQVFRADAPGAGPALPPGLGSTLIPTPTLLRMAAPSLGGSLPSLRASAERQIDAFKPRGSLIPPRIRPPDDAEDNLSHTLKRQALSASGQRLDLRME